MYRFKSFDSWDYFDPLHFTVQYNLYGHLSQFLYLSLTLLYFFFSPYPFSLPFSFFLFLFYFFQFHRYTSNRSVLLLVRPPFPSDAHSFPRKSGKLDQRGGNRVTDADTFLLFILYFFENSIKRGRLDY